MQKISYIWIVLLGVLLSSTLVAGKQTTGTADSPHVIEVVAKTFEFTPNEIHAKVGERVQIKLRTADRAHGLKLDIYPEGASEDKTPGLVFDHPQDEAKVEKHKERVIEFLAARPGTYDFKCSVQCSMGHGHDRMTGKLIVEE
ncbi:MAG TPA: cupredoxin domain-containing protein [Candidatus Acidoferrales bacterium]|jgi:heme/copper-type cytochrome/quinol oxidase subunit 2